MKFLLSSLLPATFAVVCGLVSLRAATPVNFSTTIPDKFINEGMGKIVINPTTNVALIPHFRDPAGGSTNYDDCISTYDLTTRSFIATNVYVGDSKARDLHNGINIAVDKNGYVHAAYGCHGGPLYYKKSLAANDNDLSSGFTAEKTVAGSCTYPNIICDPNNANNLIIFYRGNTVNQKAAYVRSTDGGATWSSPVTYINHSGTTDSWVYQGVVQGTDGSIHFIWTPFNGTIGNGYETKFIYYAKTTDFGATFKRSDGTTYTLPITPGTAEQVVASGAVNVFAANSMLALDTSNRPVITYGVWNSGYMKDAFWELRMRRWNGSSWVLSTVSSDPAWIGAQTVITANGKYHVYTGLKDAANNGNRKPRLLTSTNSGSTWSAPEVLSNDDTKMIMATWDRRFGSDSLVSWGDGSGNAKLLDYYSGGAEYIVDNTSAGFGTVGSWTASTGLAGYWGSNYLHDGSVAADASKAATWTSPITTTGTYQVFMRWTSAADRPNAAPVEVNYNGGVANLTVNQQANGGQWVLIGTWSFTGGSGDYVKITGADAGYTIADAVRFVQQ
jgi:hypothetical protein